MSGTWGKSMLKKEIFKKKWLKVGFLVCFGMALAVSALVRFFPLEWVELSGNFDLWRGGVSEVQLEGLHGFWKETCDPKNTNCSCVALVHGLGDNALTWKKVLLWPNEYWKEMGLRQGIRLFAVDLPGSGRTPSPKNLSDYQVRNQARILKAALLSRCQQWVVVGNSLGGWISIWLALDWPQGVSKLVLIGSAGLKTGQSGSAEMLTRPTIESMKEFQRKAYFRPRPIPDSVWVEIVKRAEQSNARLVREAQKDEDFVDLLLGTLRMPTLLLWGKEDQIVPISVGRAMRDRIPGVMWREIPECGHLPQKECPIPVIKSILDLVNYGAY